MSSLVRRFVSQGHLVDSELAHRHAEPHHRAQVFVDGSWREVSNQRMDGVIVEQGEELICTTLLGDETDLEYWEWNVKNVNS
jgi:hypothetical protein